ncbi:hypothetical protein KC644_01580, partial [Candidatus Berkelbacteria bacterium]|nr:hypothetical protein [Candidatus Berkelbacteria bacterium]
EQLFKDERKHTEQLLVEERAYNRQLLSEFATEIKNKIDESNQDRVDDVDAVTDRVANLERRVEILEKTV